MKKIILFFLTTSSFLFAQEVIHSSISTYIENKNFSHSKQKTQSNVYGIGFDIHNKKSAYKSIFEYATTKTKKPPLPKDLAVKKVFLQYQYEISKQLNIQLHFASVLEDNIAITSGGDMYGVGFTYSPIEKLSINTSHYFTLYNDFKLNQQDLKLEYKSSIAPLKIKLTSLTKYINSQDIHKNLFTKNAQKSYLVTFLALHTHYKSYHFGSAISFGNFAFATLNDGFKLQHHSMKITKSYTLGIGKSFHNLILRLQYINQKAIEMPMQNNNVKIQNIRFILNYKI